MDDLNRTPPPQWSGVRRLPGLEGRIPKFDRGAVVLSTLGSLGDLYPVLSIARRLEMAGLEPRLALSPDDCDMARRWGLLAHPVGPSRAEVCERLGVSADEVAASILRDPGPLLSEVLIPILPAMAQQIDVLAEGATCVAATTFAMGAPLAAERAAIPFVPLMLQPMLALSAVAPPRGRGFDAMQHPPRGPLGRGWNRAVLAAARAELRRRHRRDLDAVRARLGLPPDDGVPILDPGGDVPLRLGLWSDRFAPAPPDFDPSLKVVGFPPAPEGELAPSVQEWLDAGPPPLVVTLGSIAQGLGGPRFWEEAVALARRMGLRALLLSGAAEVPRGPDILSVDYAPHAPLFPQAAIVVHHGGIGTTAEAIRGGRPQLVVPIGGDQPDNAARLEAMGLAVTLRPRRFTARNAAPMLEDLLTRFDYNAAGSLGEAEIARNGAGEAALHLAQIALRRPAPKLRRR